MKGDEGRCSLLEEAGHRVTDVARVVAHAEPGERGAVVLVVLQCEDVQEGVGGVRGAHVAHEVLLGAVRSDEGLVVEREQQTYVWRYTGDT